MKLIIAKLIVGIAVAAIIGIVVLSAYIMPGATLTVFTTLVLLLGLMWACTTLEKEGEMSNSTLNTGTPNSTVTDGGNHPDYGVPTPANDYQQVHDALMNTIIGTIKAHGEQRFHVMDDIDDLAEAYLEAAEGLEFCRLPFPGSHESVYFVREAGNGPLSIATDEVDFFAELLDLAEDEGWDVEEMRLLEHQTREHSPKRRTQEGL